MLLPSTFLFFLFLGLGSDAFSALMLFVGRQKGHLACKNMEWWGAGVVICLERDANDLPMVQLMRLPPHHLLLQQNPEWFILLVPAYPGCPGKKAVKRLCMCVCVWLWILKWNFTRLLYVHTYATNVCSVFSNFDVVMPYYVWPFSEYLHSSDGKLQNQPICIQSLSS